MLAYHSYSVANCANALEIPLKSRRLVRKAQTRGSKRSIDTVRHDKRLAEKRASHFVQVAHVDERDVAIETERSQDRRFRILGIESVDLVERSLDGKCTMLIDGRSAAEILVALEYKDLVPSSAIDCPGDQAAKPRTNHDGVELSGHPQPLTMRNFLIGRH